MTEILDALDELNDSMQKAYRILAERGALGSGDEHAQRLSALRSIDEILEWRPLASFKAEHLQFLETLIAYWRELEVEAGAPEPDTLQ